MVEYYTKKIAKMQKARELMIKGLRWSLFDQAADWVSDTGVLESSEGEMDKQLDDIVAQRELIKSIDEQIEYTSGDLAKAIRKAREEERKDG